MPVIETERTYKEALQTENSEEDLPQFEGISALALVVKPIDSERGSITYISTEDVLQSMKA